MGNATCSEVGVDVRPDADELPAENVGQNPEERLSHVCLDDKNISLSHVHEDVVGHSVKQEEGGEDHFLTVVVVPVGRHGPSSVGRAGQDTLGTQPPVSKNIVEKYLQVNGAVVS